ncbi:MAG: FHA domain-containing protein [Roseiflexaceae bacterium]|nr:FHA domain-containing protein [Roseiflexaceae bacterium]
MNETVWPMLAPYTNAAWWFGIPAMAVLGLALAIIVAALLLLRRRSLPVALVVAITLGAAALLLVPSAALALQPAAALGVMNPGALPTSAFPALARTVDQTMQMGMVGSGMLLVGALGAFGGLGRSRGRACVACGRPQHPSWKECPECRLLAPAAAESPLMQLGDLSASGVPITQFGGPAQTELLESGGAPAWLAVLNGPGEGERLALGTRFVVGRDPAQCQLVLDDEAVSSRHAVIEREAQGWTLTDLGSRNGTAVNGQQVAQRQLQNADELRIGRTLLRFEADAAADATPTLLLDTPAPAACLVALDDTGGDARFPITQIDIKIGRGQQNDLVLNLPSISRHHATIRFDGEAYWLIDVGAPNGIWLDERRVLGSTALSDGQTIRLGDQRLRFEREETTNAA